MASNFRMSVHRNSDNLHLRLFGDFDGTSAHELINMIKKNGEGVYKVFIHTNCLRQIHPFGCNTFHNNINVLKHPSMQLIFTGENANQMTPS